MKSLLMRILVCLLIMLTGAHAASAQQVQPLEPEWLQKMYAEGWRKVQEGVLQKRSERGGLETFSYGAEGIQWLVQSHERRLRFFEERYRNSPNPKLAALMQDVITEISRLNSELASAPSAESVNLESEEGGCPESAYSLSAWAGPQRSPRGVAATASARFNSTACGGRQARTYAEVYVQAAGENGGSSTRTNAKDSADFNGAEIVSSVAASLEGLADCKATAVAQVTLADNFFSHTEEAPEHYGCPADITASISGPAVVTTDHYTSPCAGVTWTAGVTGGTGPYTYEWYINSAPAGSGPILTKSYCATNAVLSVRVVAQDVNSWTDEETFQTELRPIPPVTARVSGPDRVYTDKVTPCVDVTWTASASGGHPGYTYKWYTGTGATEEGTGSTFIKRFCNITQTVSVRVVASDSDGHTDDETKTTEIVHVPPPVAVISGPGAVFTDYYTSPCADVTWTASASAGYPGGYTYQWFIGGTPVGTGPTLTTAKPYCNTSALFAVRVVVTDSGGVTSDASRTTNIQYKGPIGTNISGPGSVTTNSSAPCVDVTWAASADNSGHMGFTYNWYIGTNTTVLGTGATFTQRSCNISQTVTVKLVARASDGHAVTVTKDTTITHIDPLVASITGTSSLRLADYGECRSLTWTANVSGGISPYVYSWYIGTSTTVQGTGSTLTKTFCGAQTINVKLTARDSSSPIQAKDAVFTTYIRNPREVICTGGGCP